ncbi:MAG: hypothetical protein FGF48_09805 [Candidatus Brockarchaeota archaeon]|nr:hypothetical protein [Candidatus Brockarchaeota archaeon]
MVRTTLEQVYREIKLLRRDFNRLEKMLIPEVEPEEDEIKAIRKGRRELRKKQCVEWSKVRKKI